MASDSRHGPEHRGRSYDQRGDQYGRDPYDEQREDPYRSRQDHSRSSDMQYRGVSRGRNHAPREDRYGSPDYNSRHRKYDNRHLHAGEDYGRMYDEPIAGDPRSRWDSHDEQRGDERHRSRSHSRRHHPRSHSYSPTRDAGQPNDTVILEGLPPDVSATELRESLLLNTVAVEFPSIDVRVQASRGQRRAFVQFEEVDHAIAFMKQHYPKLFVELQQSTDGIPEGRFEAYIHYARKREEWDAKRQNNVNWNCPSCDFSNYSTRAVCKICGSPPAATDWQQSLTGAADAAEVPSQILVIYPLASFVDEERLATDLKKLEREKPEKPKNIGEGAPKLKSTAPGSDTSSQGAREGSLHRVFLMRDCNTDESYKYGFAEFWTIEDAAAAVSKCQLSRTFTIAGYATNVSTIHMGVFLPEHREVTEYTERQSFHPLLNPSLRVRYRDPHVYPSQRVVTTHAPGKGAAQSDDPNAQKAKKRKADTPAASSTAKKLAIPMGGQMALWQKKHDEIHDGQTKTPEANRASPPKTDQGKGPITISLSGTSIGEPQPPTGDTPAQSDSPGEPASADTPVSYVDRSRLMCLICMRKYKSVDEVNIHERSRNHKNSTENEELVKAALPRLAIRDKRLAKEAPPTGDEASAGQYRDRAKERRAAYNQPTKPATQPGRGGRPEGSAGAKAESPASAPASAAAATPVKAAQSRGAGMLAKMGWTAGAGLGADGGGRTEAIATNAYQEGVGLGAEGSNLGDAAQLAERRTKNSYTDYVNTVQDKARERYNKMG